MKTLLILILTSFGLYASAQVDLDEGLHAHYLFSGNALDSSGNNYHGTIFGAVSTSDRFGTANNAFNFSNGDRYIDFGDIMNDVFSGIGNHFSISLWIKPSTLMSNNIIIAKTADFGCSEDQRQFAIKIFDTQLMSFTYYSTLTPQNARRVTGNTQFSDINQWYHVVFHYDGTTNGNDGKDRVRIYTNCTEEITQLETSTGILGNIPVGTAHLGIGNYLTSQGNSCRPSDSFEGIIDDVRIYNRLLNAEEIESLCNDLTVSVSVPQEDGEIFIFPNPSNGKFTITNIAQFDVFEVYDIKGRPIAEGTTDTEITLRHFSPGIYFIRLMRENDSSVVTKKVVVIGDKKP